MSMASLSFLSSTQFYLLSSKYALFHDPLIDLGFSEPLPRRPQTSRLYGNSCDTEGGSADGDGGGSNSDFLHSGEISFE